MKRFAIIAFCIIGILWGMPFMIPSSFFFKMMERNGVYVESSLRGALFPYPKIYTQNLLFKTPNYKADLHNIEVSFSWKEFLKGVDIKIGKINVQFLPTSAQVNPTNNTEKTTFKRSKTSYIKSIQIQEGSIQLSNGHSLKGQNISFNRHLDQWDYSLSSYNFVSKGNITLNPLSVNFTIAFNDWKSCGKISYVHPKILFDTDIFLKKNETFVGNFVLDTFLGTIQSKNLHLLFDGSKSPFTFMGNLAQGQVKGSIDPNNRKIQLNIQNVNLKQIPFLPEESPAGTLSLQSQIEACPDGPKAHIDFDIHSLYIKTIDFPSVIQALKSGKILKDILNLKKKKDLFLQGKGQIDFKKDGTGNFHNTHFTIDHFIRIGIEDSFNLYNQSLNIRVKTTQEPILSFKVLGTFFDPQIQWSDLFKTVFLPQIHLFFKKLQK